MTRYDANDDQVDWSDDDRNIDNRAAVFCPFSGDGVCPSDCPSNRERSCVNGEDDRVFNADVEATLKADNVCLRVPPFGESCTLGYNHDGDCDWYTATAADRAAARDRAASHE